MKNLYHVAYMIIFRPFSLLQELNSELQIHHTQSLLKLLNQIFNTPILRKMLTMHSVFYILLIASRAKRTPTLDHVVIVSFLFWTIFIFIMASIAISGYRDTKRYVVSSILTGVIIPYIGIPALVSYNATMMYMHNGNSDKAWTLSTLSLFLLAAVISFGSLHLAVLAKDRALIRDFPFFSLLMSIAGVSTVIPMIYEHTIIIQINVFAWVFIGMMLFFLQAPWWGGLQLWLLRNKDYNKKGSPLLYFETCWLPESYLATRLYHSIKEEPINLNRMLWIMKFPSQRWAVRKALILLWKDSPEKTSCLFESIRGDKDWQAPITEYDDKVLARSVEPICWEEVLLCELFGVQVDKQLLRWHERITFAPERWLRKSKTLYPPCPQDLQELALELVQPLMAQGEQAVETKFEAQTKPEST